MAKFFLTKKANDDLSGIWEYTSDFWSEDQADNYYEQLIEVCQKIAEKRFVGRSYKEVSEAILGFHFKKHIIFYQETAPNEIAVFRILHEKMDLRNRISK